MAFNELDRKRIEKQIDDFVEARRPPAEMRAQIDIGYRLEDQAIELFESRRSMRGYRVEEEFARLVHVKSRDVWKLYWKRADLKWHRYTPLPESSRLDVLLHEIDDDPNACFFG
ncbi:MAG: DUF3024 domain-containing protein [Halothiobacillaceae bacterium]|nr:DUF3024 domain-containing protein [Halothiobacillaceae bacterium]